MKKKSGLVITLLCVLFQSITVESLAQIDTAKVLAAADTSNFSVNKQGGWGLYNSFVTASGTDSVRLELILFKKENINWKEKQYVGKIKQGNLYPTTNQTISYKLIDRKYDVTVEKNGDCYFRLTSDNPPDKDEVTIPLQIKYYRK
jgi:hypothetical protein